jgi:hypothetical protein
MALKIKKWLWELANYDSFIMQYCTTQHNQIAGIGVFFIFQLFLIFSALFTAYTNFFSTHLFIGWLIAVFGSYLFYKWIKFFNKIYHQYNNAGTFVIQIIINLFLALLLTVPYCLSLFEQQVFFQLFLRTGRMNYEFIEQLWLKPFILYEIWFKTDEGMVIFFICMAVFILIAFILLTPYFLIYKNSKSSYTLVKQNYEQNF